MRILFQKEGKDLRLIDSERLILKFDGKYTDMKTERNQHNQVIRNESQHFKIFTGVYGQGSVEVQKSSRGKWNPVCLT